MMSLRDSFNDFDPAQLISAQELLQLIQLVCPDFPELLVKEGCRLCGGRGDGQYAFGQLLHAIFARFFFSEFLRWTSTCFVRRHSPAPKQARLLPRACATAHRRPPSRRACW